MREKNNVVGMEINRIAIYLMGNSFLHFSYKELSNE